MPYIILVRADNENAIQQTAVIDYTRTPAEHLNLDGQRNWNNTGFLSTFRYLPEDKVQSADGPLIPTTIFALNSGELAPYPNVHFIVIDLESFDSNLISLNGGTHGLDSDGKPQKLDGTVWVKPQLNRDYPQVFTTRDVAVELGPNKFRYAYEVLLGGNWQPFALCKTYTKDQAKVLLANSPTVDGLATQIIQSGALNPAGKNSVEVAANVAANVAIFTQQQLQREQHAREELLRMQQMEQQKKIDEERRQAENIARDENAGKEWDKLTVEQQKAMKARVLSDIKYFHYENESGAKIWLAYESLKLNETVAIPIKSFDEYEFEAEFTAERPNTQYDAKIRVKSLLEKVQQKRVSYDGRWERQLTIEQRKLDKDYAVWFKLFKDVQHAERVLKNFIETEIPGAGAEELATIIKSSTNVYNKIANIDLNKKHYPQKPDRASTHSKYAAAATTTLVKPPAAAAFPDPVVSNPSAKSAALPLPPENPNADAAAAVPVTGVDRSAADVALATAFAASGGGGGSAPRATDQSPAKGQHHTSHSHSHSHTHTAHPHSRDRSRDRSHSKDHSHGSSTHSHHRSDDHSHAHSTRYAHHSRSHSRSPDRETLKLMGHKEQTKVKERSGKRKFETTNQNTGVTASAGQTNVTASTGVELETSKKLKSESKPTPGVAAAAVAVIVQPPPVTNPNVSTQPPPSFKK